MACPSGCNEVRVRWKKYWAWLCTSCGRLWRLDYVTGRRIEIWPARRYGRKAA